MKKVIILSIIMLTVLFLFACKEAETPPVISTLSYNANNSTGGTVPASVEYTEGDLVTVQSNSGNLEKTSYLFSGWSTSKDSGGSVYAAGDTFVMGGSNISLYAKWPGVYTLAGTGTQNFYDGDCTVAQFSDPFGIAVDISGNIIISDSSNNRIRKLTPAGIVSTIAGDGTRDLLYNPIGVAVDANGDVYISDSQNNRIRMVTPTGDLSTVAGSGIAGDSDGNGIAAEFSSPAGLTLDADGNLLIADLGNNKIRKMTPEGVVSTIAGTGVAGLINGNGINDAQFDQPCGLAIDSAGNIFVADAGNDCIRRITPVGLVSTFAGTGSPGYLDGAGNVAMFNEPCDLAIDIENNIYVADTKNERIRKILTSAVVSTIAGDGTEGVTDGIGTSAQFNDPIGLCVDFKEISTLAIFKTTIFVSLFNKH